jgi:hypothetical protein
MYANYRKKLAIVCLSEIQALGVDAVWVSTMPLTLVTFEICKKKDFHSKLESIKNYATWIVYSGFIAFGISLLAMIPGAEFLSYGSYVLS